MSRPRCSLQMRRVPVLSALLFAAYHLPSWRLKQLVRWLLHRLEGGSTFSITLRRIFRKFDVTDRVGAAMAAVKYGYVIAGDYRRIAGS